MEKGLERGPIGFRQRDSNRMIHGLLSLFFSVSHSCQFPSGLATSGSRHNCIPIDESGTRASQVAEPSPLASKLSLASPNKGSWVAIPPRDGFLQPRDDLRWRLRMLTTERPAHQDTLH